MIEAIIGIVLTIASVLGVLFVGKSAGKKRAEQEAYIKQADARIDALNQGREAAKERRDVEDQVQRMPAGAADQRLRDEWSRPGN